MSDESRIAWGKMIHVFIKAGWNPPAPNSTVVSKLADDIERLNSKELREQSGGWLAPTITLTPAELRVITLSSRGYTDPEIANLVGRSPQTVKTQGKTACQKLGAHNRAHAVAIAIRQGLIDIGSEDQEIAA